MLVDFSLSPPPHVPGPLYFNKCFDSLFAVPPLYDFKGSVMKGVSLWYKCTYIDPDIFKS